MKKATAYKAAVYRGTSLEAGWWWGHAVDRQVNAPDRQIADYWIHDFLASDFKTTSKAGTKRFALAIREATKAASSVGVQEELISLRVLARRFAGESISIQGLMDNFRISQEARGAIVAQLEYEGLITDQFVLDDEEFIRYAAFTSVELDTGGVLLAPSDRFDDVFSKEAMDEDSKLYQFIAKGKIIDERLRGRK